MWFKLFITKLLGYEYLDFPRAHMKKIKEAVPIFHAITNDT